MSELLRLLDWPTVIGLFLAGAAFGLVWLAVIPATAADYGALAGAFIIAVIGTVYFALLIVLRVYTQPEGVAARTVGAWLAWLVFCAGIYLGVRLHAARR